MTATTTTARRHNPSDEPIRWTPGERLHHLFEAAAGRYSRDGLRRRVAVDGCDKPISYAELTAASHDLARSLVTAGVRPGDRVGVLVAAPENAYAALLAVSVVGAAAVPMDPAFPDERLRYIVDDAAIRVVLCDGEVACRLPESTTPVEIERRGRLTSDDVDWEPYVEDPDPVAYIVYTSGSTGRPKGVMVAQSSICNFLRVAADCYGFRPGDRVYQGLTIAFDFSVEEIWVPLISGATLVPRPAGPNLVGAELREFLIAHDISALCCVPTLLSTITEPVDSLRLLLVSGEACPPELARRWLERGVRMLNVYGPTETTVTATWAVLHPDEPLTIGHPLPTYAAFVVDRLTLRPLPTGEVGELAIAGPGVAIGYLNRPDLTAAAFVDLETPSGLTERGYLTGDLARIGAGGAIEYHGRADSQVKLRGYRIELAEIESALLDVDGITAAVVDTVDRDGAVVDLVAYVCGVATNASTVIASLQRRLPAYMVPAYIEILDAIPITASGKLDRAALPAPSRRANDDSAIVEPRTPTEHAVASALAATLQLERVSATDDFFVDLGADSLLMAVFCSRLRDDPSLPPVTIRDPYGHRSVAALAAHLDLAGHRRAARGVPTTAEPAALVSARRFVACAAVQLGVVLGWPAMLSAGIAATYDWTVDSTGDTALLHFVVGALVLAMVGCLGPVPIHRALVAGTSRRDAPLWSNRFLRYWAARYVIRFSPLGYLTGSALQLTYLRLLGAQVGPGVVFLSRAIPGCPDQVTIGPGSVISKEVHFVGLAADRSGIRTGPIVLGAGTYVGAGATLDIDTRMGDGAQLGHASSLHRGQQIPAGQRWHGSPAVPTSDVLRELDDVTGELTTNRHAVAAQSMAILILAIAAVGADIALGRWVDQPGTDWARYLLYAAMLGAVGYLGMLVLRYALAAIAAPLLSRLVEPDRIHPRTGRPWLAARLLAVLSNSKALTALVGDSSYAVGYARSLGYRISLEGQTGSTFGMDFKHDSPGLVSIGDRSMASDGLSVLNLEATATTFRLRRTSIGADCYLGNTVVIPPGVSLPDNCLLATKVMVPMGADLSPGVGLLGSPAFEIPRTVARDTAFDELKVPATRRALIRAKNKYNLATIALAIAAQLSATVLGLVVFAAVVGDAARPNPLLAAASAALVIVVELGYSIAIERIAVPGRRIRPAYHSIYDVRFWRHERMWKLSVTGLLHLLDGTALKPIAWRLLGVKVGRRLYDAGATLTEKTMVTIGDGCVLGEQSTLQCHSLEDATFKSEQIHLGDGCVVGDHSLVHYGTRLDDRAVVLCDAFVMKGERIPAEEVWSGNPAGAVAG